LNPLIKVMNLVALLILPAVINLRDNDAARLSIAGVSLLILIVSIVRSSRQSNSLVSA
jgi:K(+)-stimulated pyrophosphate-energized sodium pump